MKFKSICQPWKFHKHIFASFRDEKKRFEISWNLAASSWKENTMMRRKEHKREREKDMLFIFFYGTLRFGFNFIFSKLSFYE
jgi:hypothetical protein